MTTFALRDLCANGHVLIVTSGYPPIPGGSSVTMRNLLSNFSDDSYTIATTRAFCLDYPIDGGEKHNTHYVSSTLEYIRLLNRLDRHWRRWQHSRVLSRLRDLAERLDPQAIVGVFPNYFFLKAAREISAELKIPWVAYLHDTIAESLCKSQLTSKALQLQNQVFAEASSILVMSEGMADLYRRKYDLACRPLEHPYFEEIPRKLPSDTPVPRQALWCGEIRRSNANSLRRISEAMKRIECQFLFLHTGTTLDCLKKEGMNGNNTKTDFFRRRVDYLGALRDQGILVLALNWPDEVAIHEDEMSTIFSTKTPEFLASGRPILVHCPEHYFLARFFRKNRCGLVVSKRSVDALAEAGSYLLEDSDSVRNMRQSALSAARLFAGNRIAALFAREVNETAIVKWGERSNSAESILRK